MNGNGVSFGPSDSDAANFSVSCNYSDAIDDTDECTKIDPAPDNGITTFSFNVSSELASPPFGGKLIGGCVPLEGTGGSDPDCGPPNKGATTGTIVFRTTILENFVDDYPSTDASVDQGDELTNNVTIFGNLLSVADASTPTGEVKVMAVQLQSLFHMEKSPNLSLPSMAVPILTIRCGSLLGIP